MGRPRKIQVEEQPEKQKETRKETKQWFILQGFSFGGIMYNRGEEVPGDVPDDLLESLYERKYIGKITSTGIQVCNKPTILSEAELIGLHKVNPAALKSYIEARNVSKESLQRLVKMNKLNPTSMDIVLTRLTALEVSV